MPMPGEWRHINSSPIGLGDFNLYEDFKYYDDYQFSINFFNIVASGGLHSLIYITAK